MDFFSEYYLWFVIGGIILIMALIGYIADKTDFGRKDITTKKTNKEKIMTEEEPIIKPTELENNVEPINEVEPTGVQSVVDVAAEPDPNVVDNQASVDITDIDPFVMPDNNGDVPSENNVILPVDSHNTEDEDIEIKEVTDDSTFAFNNDLSSFAARDLVNPIASADVVNNNIPEVISDDTPAETINNINDNPQKESQDTQEIEDDIWKF